MIEPRLVDIKHAAKENTLFRKVLFTAPRSQVVLMALEPGQDIGEESHDVDQLIYAVKGEGAAVFNGVQEPFVKGTLFCVPAGATHNVINTGDEPLRLFTVYAPPQHADGTVHPTKADALAAEEAEATSAGSASPTAV